MASAAPKTPYDVLVIGGGLYGTSFASIYLELHPTANIIVLDSGDDVGGVWERKRLYPNFWSQTGVRISGFADVPFEPPPEAERYHDLCEGKYLTQYLENYVSDHQFNGRSLRDRFVFQCWVRNVTKVEDQWLVEASLGGHHMTYGARKVVIATGLSSVPNMPDIPNRERFARPIVHQKDFGRSNILTPDEADTEKHTHITILGGSKSAADIAYAAATDTNAPRKVNWIIRKSGSGPLQWAQAKPPLGMSKYRNVPETGSTRALACLSPANPYLPANSWREWFLYGTPVGERILESVYGRLAPETAALADFYGRAGRLEGFERLESQTNVRWRSGPLGLMQRDDFWDVVARKVQVYREDVTGLTEDSVVLGDGQEVRTDVLLCATGWKQEHPYFDAEQAVRLGLPVRLTEVTLGKQINEQWAGIDEKADQNVLERWPFLKATEKFKQRPVNSTPYRLYNLTVPMQDQSIVFLGLPLVPNSYHTSLAQSLYAIACLDSAIRLPPLSEMESQTAFTNAWCRRRYPAHGYLGNVLENEMVSWTDRLLEELGLCSHRLSERERKTWSGWWRDLTDPALMSNYAGLVDEYRRKYVQGNGAV